MSTNGTKPRAPKNTKPLTVGQALDLVEKEARDHVDREVALHRRHKEQLAGLEARLNARLEAIMLRVPEDGLARGRARELCGVPEPAKESETLKRDLDNAVQADDTFNRSLEEDYAKDMDGINGEADYEEPAIPPALLTEPAPVPYTEIDRTTGTTTRKAMGGGR